MGYADVDAMLESMTPRQFEEWFARDRIEPIGNKGIHDLLTRIGSCVASMVSENPVSEKEFRPWKGHEPPEPVATAEQIIAMARAAGIQ